MSLISAIKDAIFTETPGNVTVNERSLLSVMLDNDNNGKSLSWDNFKIKIHKGEPLLITRIIIQVLRDIVLGFIGIVYLCYNVFHWIITGKWRGMHPSSGINAIISLVTLISAIVTLIYIFAFFMIDVVIAPNNARTNSRGVITIDQPCLESHSFFLLNSATCWTPTDIQISEGDKVYVTASGSMYSDIGNMYEKALNNDTLDYSRSSLYPHIISSQDTSDVKYCIYGRYKNDRCKSFNEYPRYGSVLYQICNNHKGPILYNDSVHPNEVKQLNFNDKNQVCNYAKKSGFLYLTFNDILLDKETFENIKKDNRDIWKKEFVKTGKTSYDSIKDSKIWFQDNIGEILVNVRIEKNILNSDLPWYKKILMLVYRDIDHSVNQSFFGTYLGILVTYISIFLLFDILISTLLRVKMNKVKHTPSTS